MTSIVFKTKTSVELIRMLSLRYIQHYKLNYVKSSGLIFVLCLLKPFMFIFYFI